MIRVLAMVPFATMYNKDPAFAQVLHQKLFSCVCVFEKQGFCCPMHVQQPATD